MADINLGQVSAVWLENSEPPHKNVLWIKTINLLTSEKAGFIWNGVEWINIQGQGFYWKGEFDLEVDYTKNDVVRFEDILYIKLNNIVNNDDNPDENDDFDLFLPSFSPQGLEGSVQIKDANNRFFGSSLLSFISGLFSLYGSFFIKSNSSSSGNAFEIKNLSNQNLTTYQNDGKFTRNVSLISNDNDVILNYGDYTRINFTFSGSGDYRDVIGFRQEVYITANTTTVANKYVGLYLTVVDNGSVTTNYHKVGLWANLSGGGNGVAGYFNNCLLVGSQPVYYNAPVTSTAKGLIGIKAFGDADDIGLDIQRTANDKGMRTVARFRRGFVLGEEEPFENMLDIGDGMQMRFSLFIDRRFDFPNAGTNDTITNDFVGVRVKTKELLQATSEMFFKTTELGVSVESLVLTGKDVKVGYSDGKMGFYGNNPILKQNLPVNPTNAELATVLSNLGLVNLITP